VPGWDEDSSELEANLAEAQRLATEHALARRRLTLANIKAWHRATMKGLKIEEAASLGVATEDLVGNFRGPPKLAGIGVGIGAYRGTPSKEVAAQTQRFIEVAQTLLAALDERFPADELDTLDNDGLRAVAEAAAWAHCDWVRVHPFGNGNGRTSRLIGNAVLVRYGLLPVFRLRPRPEGDYENAAAAAMRGDHLPMTAYVINELRARAKP
jgi:prophage maintenance system killer protein